VINKICPTVESTVADIADGATVMIGGFGTAGLPNELVEALIDRGARELRSSTTTPATETPAWLRCSRRSGFARSSARSRGTPTATTSTPAFAAATRCARCIGVGQGIAVVLERVQD